MPHPNALKPTSETVLTTHAGDGAMPLRPYQRQAIDAVRRDWVAGRRDVLLVAATGAGKTQMFLRLLIDELGDDRRGLILAHRQELIDQPLERLRQLDPAWLTRDGLARPRVGVVMAARDECDRQLVTATVQTLASERRLARLLDHGPIDYLVIDEAHHAVAPTYLRIYERLKAVNPDLRHLGVTATPIRGDGAGLIQVYQHVSAQITIADLVRQGYLVQPRWLGISTGLSLNGVRTSGGDFVQSQLARVFDTSVGREIIVRAYQTYAAGRRAIAFTASVAGAHALAATFRAAGISAVAVDGTTPREERQRLMAAFRAGQFQILTNCQVATEGFDAPGTSCILMCRPTRSDALYVQAMGRGLRPALGRAQPGEDCLILDFLPVETRNVVMAGDVLGLPREVTRTVIAERATDVAPGEAQAGFTFDGERFDSSGTPLEIVARQLDYLQTTPWCWERWGGWLILGLGTASDGRERILAIAPPAEDGRQQLYGLWREPDSWHWQVAILLESTDLDALIERAESTILRYGAGALIERHRRWHHEPISEGQRRLLRRLAAGEIAHLERLSKGEAARAITYYRARAVLQRAGVWR